MSDAFWTALPGAIASGAALLTALATLISVFWNSRKLEVIHKATNSMHEEIVKVTGEAEHAKGRLEGTREAGTARSDAQERHTA